MSHTYNGFIVKGNLTADQKRSLSMTRRSLERKGIRFGDSVSESVTAILDRPRVIKPVVRIETKAERFVREVIVPRAKARGGCAYNSSECAGKEWGPIGQKWHYSCAEGRAYAAAARNDE